MCAKAKAIGTRTARSRATRMTIALELAARIERLYTVERWRVGTIARQLHVHRDTVRRVLREHNATAPGVPLRQYLVDPYRPFILQTLAKYPTLTASRLHDMVRERGYAGQASHFRHLVASMRPRPPAEAYLRLRTLPGEQMQCDWGHFGHLQIGRARRPLMGFVMVLSYSRRIFLRFCLNAQMDSFLRGHVEAFSAFGGLARTLLYDNLKSVVLERVGDAIRFNPEFLAFAKHYRFEPRPVAVARGNQKGRVERQIDFVRKSFFAAREFTDVADLNAQARQWCEGRAFDRPWPEDDSVTVRQAFALEQPRLLGLPDAGYVLGERLDVPVAKTPYVRFDLNDYTLPHTHVRRTVSVLADEQRVRIFDGITELADHPRCFDRHQQVEDPAHLQALVAHKRHARAHRGCDALAQVAPASTQLLQMAAQRGHNLGSITAALLRLLDQYAAPALQAAILDAISRDVPHPNAVRFALERSRERSGRPPPLALALPEHVARRDAPMRTHSLDSYDRRYDPPKGPPKDTDDD
jgi:transposase